MSGYRSAGEADTAIDVLAKVLAIVDLELAEPMDAYTESFAEGIRLAHPRRRDGGSRWGAAVVTGGRLDVDELGEPPLTEPQLRALLVLAAAEHADRTVKVGSATSLAIPTWTVHRTPFFTLRLYGLVDYVTPSAADWRARLTGKGRERAERERYL